jgi:Protein of unknown function (DUF1152)
LQRVSENLRSPHILSIFERIATEAMETLQPTFLQRLASDRVRTVLLTGCGGGFDFVHAMLLYTHLRSLGKEIVFLSFSFGNAENIRVGGGDEAEAAATVFREKTPDGPCVCKRVNAQSTAPEIYRPEVSLCGFLDETFPDEPKHEIYACYARQFSVPMLTRLYRTIVHEHGVDTLVCVDGGTDSLLRGDEHGLGDPIEDTVSLTTVALFDDGNVHTKLLLAVGFGMDRFNNVSDGAFSFPRAVLPGFPESK